MGFGAISLKGRALRYLAQREHSRRELERKLAPHAEDGPEATAAQQIAAALDDLVSKGLPPELIAATLQQAKGTELERAQEVWRKRFGKPPGDAAERAKQMRFLAGRGFESDTIRCVVQGAEWPD